MSSDTINTHHKPSMKPSSRALRDHWLKNYSEHAILGKTYTSNGAVLFEGMTATEWLEVFKVFDNKKRAIHIGPVELRKFWMKLAENYSKAASFHANLTLAADALSDEVQTLENEFIKTESEKYQAGGEYWDEELRKPTHKKPALALLERQAKASTAATRGALATLKREAAFFHHCMMNLETQRRCFKDYAELLALDPATRNLV